MKMKLLALFLLFAATLFGQLPTCSQLLSTQSLTFSEPHYGPWSRAELITVTFSGGYVNWTRVLPTGPYTSFTDANNVSTNSTSTSVYVYLTGGVDFQPVATGYTDFGTIQFNTSPAGTPINCTINVTYSVIATTHDSPGPFTNNLGIADSALAGCTHSGGTVLGCDLIPASTVGSLPGGSDLRPANGATVTSAEFGTKIRRCSPPDSVGYIHVYSSINAMNSDNSVIAGARLNSNLALIDTATCSSHFLNSISSTILWDWAWAGHTPQNNRAWGFVNNTIVQYIFDFSTWTATPTTVYTFSGASSIGNGSTDDINDLGYIAFSTDTDHSGNANHPNICVVQIGVWTEICADLSVNYSVVIGNLPNYVELSKGFDPRTNKAYLLTNTQSQGCLTLQFCYGPEYSFHAGDTSLTFEKYFGVGVEATIMGQGSPWTNSTACTSTVAATGACLYTGAHSHTAEDSAGRQYWVSATDLQYPFSRDSLIMDLTATSALDTVSKFNGGGTDVGLSLGSVTVSSETGCIRDWCAVTWASPQVTSWRITNVTASGGNSTITLDSAPGSALTTGTGVVIGNIGGCTQLNSSNGWPGSSVTVSGSTVTINGTGNCPSGYTANTGALAANVYPSSFTYRNEVILIHVSDGSTIETRRLGQTNSIVFSDTWTEGGGYWPGVGCSLTHDLTLAVCHSNGGKPDEDAILLMSTGIQTGGQSAQDYTYDRTITINHTEVPNADQMNFPMLFNTTDGTLKTIANGGHVTNANGYDIIFTSDAAGTVKLDHEIESYNAATGQFIAWVRIPTLSHTTDTTVYMFYGNSNVTTSQENITGVWDSNYLGVWHWPNGTTLTTNDSTSNANSATVNGTGIQAAAGEIDGGAHFPGSGPNSIDANATPIDSLTSMTFSTWVNLSSTSTLQDLISVNGEHNFEINSGGFPSITITTTEGFRTATASSPISTNAWHYIAGTVSSSDNLPHLYVDGSEVSYSNQNAGSGSTGSSGTELAFGAFGGNPYARNLTGTLDEQRISKLARSADWIATEYNNQNSPSTFMTLGPEQ